MQSYDRLRYDTIVEFNVDTKAELTSMTLIQGITIDMPPTLSVSAYYHMRRRRIIGYSDWSRLAYWFICAQDWWQVIEAFNHTVLLSVRLVSKQHYGKQDSNCRRTRLIFWARAPRREADSVLLIRIVDLRTAAVGLLPNWAQYCTETGKARFYGSKQPRLSCSFQS